MGHPLDGTQKDFCLFAYLLVALDTIPACQEAVYFASKATIEPFDMQISKPNVCAG